MANKILKLFFVIQLLLIALMIIFTISIAIKYYFGNSNCLILLHYLLIYAKFFISFSVIHFILTIILPPLKINTNTK